VAGLAICCCVCRWVSSWASLKRKTRPAPSLESMTIGRLLCPLTSDLIAKGRSISARPKKMNNRGGEFFKWAIVVFIGQVSFPQQAVKQSIGNAGGDDRDHLISFG